MTNEATIHKFDDPEYLKRFITSTIKESKNIDEARKGMFGGGLMKSLARGEKDAEQRADNVFNFFRTVASGNAYEIGKFAERNLAEYKSAVNDGRITDIEFKTLSPAIEGTAASGGYAVPIEWAADLSRNLGKYGYARRHLRNISMERNLLNIPGLLTKPSVAVVAENGTIAASKPTMDNLQLTAKKIAGIYSASIEYLQDTNIDNYGIILDIYTEQFQIGEDTAAFQNANTDWNGMLWYGAGAITSGVAANGARAVSRTGSASGGATTYNQLGDTAAATDIWGDLLLLLQNQPSALYEGGKFFIPQECLIAAIGMRDADKRMLNNIQGAFEVKTGLDGQPALYLFGYEAVVLPNGIMITYDASAHVGAPFIAFCNPIRAYAMMGTRGGFTVDLLREATLESISLAANYLEAYRMTERLAFGIGRPNTVSVLRCDAS